MISVVVTPRAKQDARTARRWYERQRSGLGSQFVDALTEAIAALQRSPAMYARVHGEFRRMRVRKFPYGVFYRVEGERVIVHRILHDRQSLSHLEN
jgi:plasmid stabilization system protein ParE